MRARLQTEILFFFAMLENAGAHRYNANMTQDNIKTALDALKNLFGARLTTATTEIETHSHDETHAHTHPPDAVVYPLDAGEVSALIKICAQNRCPIIPFGVGTSLEGHVVPFHGGISVDMSRMNTIITINQDDMDAVVEAGVTRNQLNHELRTTGLMFTVDPGADATMGGMASTSASGTNSVRYGTIRDNILAMEVITPDGTILELGSRARKSASGYDLKNLFIGAEGSLGIITKLTVKLHGVPESISAARCAFDDIHAAVQAVILAIQSGIPMARIELLDEVQMRGVNVYNTDFNAPEKPHLFLEFHGSETAIAEQVELFQHIAEECGGSEFAWANSTETRNKLWSARHNAYYAAKALKPNAATLVTDCCVPISALAETIKAAKTLVEDAGLIAPLVGHVGDGNFHLLVLLAPDDEKEWARAKTLAASLNQLALDAGGTISGEHGIGSGKIKYMESEHGDAYHLMRQIKTTIDPNGIMNPGKIFASNT